jgi:hypothetical protein
MKLRLLATVVVLALTTVAAHAQIGLYVNPAFIRVSNNTPDTGVFAFLGSGQTSRMFYGANIGGYYDFYRNGNLEAGIDIRNSISHGNAASLNGFLVGPRVAVSPFAFPLKPYAQVFIGAGSTRAATTSVGVTRAQFGVLGGADYTVHRHIDIRVIEIGYSALDTVSSYTVGATTTSYPSSRVLSFSTGLVFRFRDPASH